MDERDQLQRELADERERREILIEHLRRPLERIAELLGPRAEVEKCLT